MVEASTVICIDVMNFAQRLVALRKQRGLTQQALADRVGIHVSNIRRYEAASSQPTLDVLRNVALALATSADSLSSTRTSGVPTTTCACSSRPPASSMTTRRRPSRPSLRASSSATTPGGGPARRSCRSRLLTLFVEYWLEPRLHKETFYSLLVAAGPVNRENKRPDPETRSVGRNTTPIFGPKYETVYGTDAIMGEVDSFYVGCSDHSGMKEVND